MCVCVCQRSANSYFELEWRDGRVCVRAANGKYVIAKKNGQLAATVDSTGQSCLFDVSELTAFQIPTSDLSCNKIRILVLSQMSVDHLSTLGCGWTRMQERLHLSDTYLTILSFQGKLNSF